MADIAYLVSSLGHPDEEIERRERIATDLVPGSDAVRMVQLRNAPLSVESTVEKEHRSSQYIVTQ